jgi:3'-phosphoadenosine 5'-phosphosulfate synthase
VHNSIFLSDTVHQKGDGDPIDAIEIGNGPLPMASVVSVKVLGSMELIDEGETDHKIIVLRESDANFDDINSVDDLESFYPGVTARLVDWLKNYKTSDGKPQNKLKHEEPTSRDEAIRVIKQVSSFYKKLIKGETKAPDNYALPSKK